MSWNVIGPDEFEAKSVELVACVGGFVDAVAEIFLCNDGQHHVHFYMNRDAARSIWSKVKQHFANYAVNSVSFED